jgi:hypothetical protein
MRQRRGQPDQPGAFIDRGVLDGGELLPPERLAYRIQPAGEVGVVEAAVDG